MTDPHRTKNPAELLDTEPPRRVLEEVETPIQSSQVTLTSGRRYEIAAEGESDRLTIRSRGGEVILRIEVTDAGPVLAFSGASIDLSATQRLRLRADAIDIAATRDLALAAGGALTEEVGGDHHLHVGGAERVEAAEIELQANEKSVSVRAMGKIALDGEHIGLNDDPAPQPFPWSDIADGPEEHST